MEGFAGALDALGPWLADLTLVGLLFVSLVRGWLQTPASMQKAFDSQEERIRVAEAREKEWKDTAKEAIAVTQAQSKQFDTIFPALEAILRLIEAFPRPKTEGGSH